MIYTSHHHDLAEGKVASWLSKHSAYSCLEPHGLAQVSLEGELLRALFAVSLSKGSRNHSSALLN